MNNLPLRALLFLVWLVACMPALAQTTVTLQQGLNSYTGTTDTWLWSGGPDINHGGEDEWQMRFNTTTATLLRFAIFQAEGGPVPNGDDYGSDALGVQAHRSDQRHLQRAAPSPPVGRVAGNLEQRLERFSVGERRRAGCE